MRAHTHTIKPFATVNFDCLSLFIIIIHSNILYCSIRSKCSQVYTVIPLFLLYVWKWKALKSLLFIFSINGKRLTWLLVIFADADIFHVYVVWSCSTITKSFTVSPSVNIAWYSKLANLPNDKIPKQQNWNYFIVHEIEKKSANVELYVGEFKVNAHVTIYLFGMMGRWLRGFHISATLMTTKVQYTVHITHVSQRQRIVFCVLTSHNFTILSLSKRYKIRFMHWCACNVM